jgi:hypothetical protein
MSPPLAEGKGGGDAQNAPFVLSLTASLPPCYSCLSGWQLVPPVTTR